MPTPLECARAEAHVPGRSVYVLRERLRSDDLEWERGKAWAFEQSMGAIWYYVDTNPGMNHMGRRTLDRIMADMSRE